MKGSIKLFLIYVIPALVIIGLIGYLIVRPPSVDKVGTKLRPTPDPVVGEEQTIPAGH